MSNSINRDRFVRLFDGHSLDVQKAEADPRLQGVNVRAADLNNDGQVKGAAEAQALFLQIDRIDRDGNGNTITPETSKGVSTAVAAKLDAVGDLAKVESFRAIANLRGQRSNNDVLLVGMNAGSRHEAEQLGRQANVTRIGQGTPDQITVGRRTYDLTQADQVTAFTQTLGLPAAQAAQVADAINQAGPDAKDELAKIAQVWAKGERGENMPSRLVLSGHSVGDGVWGDDNGTLAREDVRRLAEALPKAAARVEDLHIAGCYSGGESDLQAWRDMFPNLQTQWAYTGSAPGSYSGAVPHLKAWEIATRGGGSEISRDVVAGTRKGENVAVWSRDDGYADGRPPRTLTDVRASYDATQARYADFFSGRTAVADSQTGPLRDHYNNLQALLQHRDLPAAERGNLETQRDQTIRLLYYRQTVAPKFNQHYSAQIQAGYQAMGLQPPNFATLSRQDAQAQIQAFEAAVQARGANAPQAARDLLPLLQGLRDLNPAVIPDGWV